MATKTKKPAKAGSAPAPEGQAPAPTAREVRPMPADWQGPSRWTGKSLAWKLDNSGVTRDERLFDALGVDEPEGGAGFGDRIVALYDRWLTERLKEHEREAVWQFLRLASWLDGVDGATADFADIAIPDCLLPVMDPAYSTAERLAAVWWPEQVLNVPVTGVPALVVDEPAPTVEADGQIALVTEPAKPITIKPMAFRTAEEVGAVRRALESELKELEKMAKDSDAMGEPAAAKIFRDKALLLKTQLLPQVTAQQALPFNSAESLPGMIARTVAGEVRARARAALMKNITVRKGETQQDAQQRQLEKLDELEALIGNVAEQVGALATKFVSAAAERGIDAGKKALQAEASAVAREAIQLVEFELQSGRAA